MERTPDQISIKDLPQRPKPTGKLAYSREATFVSNYFKLQMDKNKKVYQFAVSFEPQIENDSRNLIRKCILSVRKEIEDKLGNFHLSGNILWADKGPLDQERFPCKYISRSGEQPIKYDNVLILRKTKCVSLKDLDQSSLQILNTKLKSRLIQSGMVQLGKTSKYFIKGEIDDYKVEGFQFKVWKGFMANIHKIQGQDDLYICVDAVTRVLARENLLSVMNRAKHQDDILGRSALAQYGNFKTYPIIKISNKTPQSTFEKHGQTIKYHEYYKKQYNITIKDLNQKLILSKSKMGGVESDIYLVPQLLYLTGVSDWERQNFRLMQAIAYDTKMSPQQRMQAIWRFIKRMSNNIQFTISNQQKIVKGLEMDKPEIVIGNDRKLKIKEDGKLDLKDGELLGTMNLKNWIIVFSNQNQKDLDTCDTFVQTLKKCGKGFGLTIPKPIQFIVKEGGLQTFKSKISNDCQKNGTKDTDIIVTILNKGEESYYKPLKQLMYCDLGVPHQVVLAKKINDQKKVMSICTGVLLQMIAKTGNPLWKVVTPIESFKQKKVIVAGMSISHKLVTNNQSCCAFVGSIDNHVTQFFSSAKLIPTNSQRFQSIKTIITNWVKAYCTINRGIPDYIILYRDGVGESQVGMLIEYEVKIIQQTLETIKKKMKLKQDKHIAVAYISVNTKINQRFFQRERSRSRQRTKGAQSIGNPPCGSVVGASMSRGGFDFKMSPHYVTEGTCNLTKFQVVYNTTKLSEEEFYKFTYDMCYTYFNWRGPVRVPGVLRCANRLATMVNDVLKREPTEGELKNKLYFL